ncbi:hypothetical protein [Ectobacillus antri]|nr:hypothetical protein [Ectobacillus antri]
MRLFHHQRILLAYPANISGGDGKEDAEFVKAMRRMALLHL